MPTKCPSCGFENPEGMKFCGECAASLNNRCPSCGFENPPGFKFCGKCGTPLTSQTPVPDSHQQDNQQPRREQGDVHKAELRSTERRAIEAERRQLTVMFCDLVGSTALSARLDPEELRDVVGQYQELCAKAVNRFEGYIAQYLGDGILLYFGYPQAHEDDAQRAVHAGLSIIEEMHRLNNRLQREIGVSLPVRVGIHTGLVVVGEIGEGERREQLALGETPNVAARLQNLADPSSVVISASTFRLVQGFFACQSFGFHSLKGLSQPMQVFKVLGDSGALSRLDVAIATGLTPLVGKEKEIELLLDLWRQVKGRVDQVTHDKTAPGGVVLLSGEAGIGKSRLLQEFKERVDADPQAWLESRCTPYYQNSALYPIIDLLQRMLDFKREETPEDKLIKLEQMLGRYGLSLPEMAPLFAALLSVPIGERYPSLNLSPQRQKQQTYEAILALLLKMAAQQPIIVVVEDLHWVDPSTLELLNLLVVEKPMANLLALLTFRPEFTPPWTSLSNLTHITLGRQTPKQVEMMAKQIAGGKALPASLLLQIVAKTDGIPLFVEELTKMVIESGLLQEQEDKYELTGALPSLAIPSTLYDSLMARLDRLSTVKEVAQLGATLGREFTFELMRVISNLDEATLQQDLERLVDAELLLQQGVPPQARYSFKHALIQDAAYQSLLKSKRQQYHQQIVEALRSQFPETVETEPEILAHHYTEAGLHEPAIDFWRRAGKRAAERSAHVEALHHLNKGLKLLEALPEDRDRLELELEFQTMLGPTLMATKGYASPEVEKAYARAHELLESVKETPRFFPVLRGLLVNYLVRGELQHAQEVAEVCLGLADFEQDPAMLLEACRSLGVTLFCRGELAEARNNLLRCIELYDPEKHFPHAFVYGHDSGVTAMANLAIVLWLLGYPEQALQRKEQALTLARKLSHAHSLAYALTYSVFFHQLRHEPRAARDQSASAIAFATKQGFPLWAAMAKVLQGWALAEQGQLQEGIDHIGQGLAEASNTGSKIFRPHWLALLGKVYGKAGRVQEGLDAIAEALAMVEKSGERWYEAELYRLKGELTLMLSTEKQSEAESQFCRALEIARGQNAKSLELRAAISLSRLWQRRQNKDRARYILADIYGWFTEGSGTTDLKEAKARLDELNVKRKT
jgi:class 3 adenylate cyclase/predicted ATPase